MEALPDDLDLETLPRALVDGWGFDVETLEYVALGAGSYHWLVRDHAGTSRFVTVDDLDQKAWFGATRDAVFDGLRRAFDTARALRDHGLDLVVAPLTAHDGATLRRLGPRYTVALFPFVDGRPAGFWEHDPAERIPLVKPPRSAPRCNAGCSGDRQQHGTHPARQRASGGGTARARHIVV
jgi:spectinomycin phosphotransferase